ncbi:MAG: class I tRNA ligase family protein, partial [Gammaproteobacteria bacterium]
GFTVDAEGKKMSKSSGNVVAPQTVMKTLGADVLRLWVSATDYRAEMSVSDEILKRTSDVYRRLRNTARFLLSNLDGFDPGVHTVAKDDMLALDRWVVDRAFALQQDVIAAYRSYQFHQVYQKVHNFCAVDLGGFYLDIIKDRQYTAKRDSLARRSAQTAMYHIAEALTRWLAPIISYTADEIWQYLPGERGESVFLETWYDGLFVLDNDDLMNREFWNKVMAIRVEVSKQLEQTRKQGLIGAALNAEVTLYADERYFPVLKPLESELHFVFITSKATVEALSSSPLEAMDTELNGLRVKVAASEHKKCVRCWHQREDVGTHSEHPELCGRCIENVDGDGEPRQFT